MFVSPPRKRKLAGMGIPAWLLCAFAISMLTPRIAFWHLTVPLGCALLFWAATGKAFLKALRHRLIWLPTLYVAVGFAYRFLGFSSASWGNYARFLIMLVAYWAGYYAWNFMETAQRRKVLVVVFLTFAVNLLDQFRLNLLNPGMQAYFLRSGIYGEVNLGKTNFICCVMVFSLFLLGDLVNGRPNNPRWKQVLFGSLVALTVMYFVTYAQSATITLCFLFAGVLFLVVGNAKPGDKGLFLRLLGASLAFSFLVAMAPMILSWGMELLEPIAGNKFLARLQTLQHLAENSLDTSDLKILTRRDLIAIDIDNWLESPGSFLVGKGLHITTDFDVLGRAELTGAGNHSGYVDILPRYGLLGLFAIVAMTVSLWKYFLHGCDKQCFVKLKILLLTLVFYNMANKVFHADVIFSIMFLLPFLRQKPCHGLSRKVLQWDAASQWRRKGVATGGNPPLTVPKEKK